MPIIKDTWGKTVDGRNVQRFILKNDNQIEIHVISFGGIITHMFLPDKFRHTADVNLGFDTIEGYLTQKPYFGALVGRYANRIKNGRFTLDGKEYSVTLNRERFSLHGGNEGFDKKIWDAEVKDNKVVLTYVSADGEEGYPGELTTTVTYELTEDNKLILEYTATTTKPTVLNLTNHAYFNLAGHDAGTLKDHMIQINVDQYLPGDSDTIPLGTIADVTGTALDLTEETDLGERIPQVPGGFGFDLNYCAGDPGKLKYVARVAHPPSGRTMKMYTTEPGVQFYTGCNLRGVIGKDGTEYKRFASICLEAQHYPNSPNQDNFPSTVLLPGEVYKQTTIYEFGIDAN
ncbi:hypothetical protein CHS0354_039673 [Potamilus streckersoni]|uniref:Aldose 1-epimerase n=1 Tax=Potamilus streckersoni TaxID=2493646 RepID=A0AAE0SJT1_9BIVA|nr:hypothetical protein CHS0354_039673 [Potamilus streckersoni]